MPISSRFVVRSTIGLLAVAFAILLMSVGATAWLGEQSRRHFNDVIAGRDLRSAANQLREGLAAGESSQRGFVLTGNEIYLAPYDNAKVVAQAALERLVKALVNSPERRPMLERLHDVTRDKILEMDASISAKRTGQDAAAMEIVRTNRGKALMDEAIVFVTALVLEADEKLTASVAEQTANTAWLRRMSLIGALIILAVVGLVVITLHRYTTEIIAARDEVRQINENLEDRVRARTSELAVARDRAEVLLAEVNHRVANSLTLVSSLVRLQAGSVSDTAAKRALAETQTRIQAIAELHRHLFTSGNVGDVAVDEYLSTILGQLVSALTADGSKVKLTRSLEHVTLPTTVSINLGIIIAEWVTNAFKYAYPDGRGEIRVRLMQRPDHVEAVVEDDGIGRVDGRPVQGSGLGTRIVVAIAGSMSAQVTYADRQPGTQARLVLPLVP